ncbi:hypothetical protein [Actinoplanes sp. ATCC 53533]|uniref:hypothetical protein n=1 Tax=Actinoplanes sp. ATCC 53533 TaxID=1288362 RepID=UPI000F7B3424|nr:hypothetical protein [Actinoplanes sp. ATCC 53533]
MGATPFEQYADVPDPDAAFAAARQSALHQHGHGGYTGSLAEKDSYLVITSTPVSPDQAKALAADLIRRADPRIDDKWGPAGAIAVCRAAAGLVAGVDGWLFFGWASS